MIREIDHWLIEDDNQNDFPLPEVDSDEDGFHNEFNPKEFEPYDDGSCYEALIP
jgi:hypothetical protein